MSSLLLRLRGGGAVRAAALAARQRPAQAQLRAQAQQQRGLATASPLYKTTMQSNLVYVTGILLGAVVLGGLYNKAGDYVWETSNRGVRYACLRGRAPPACGRPACCAAPPRARGSKRESVSNH